MCVFAGRRGYIAGTKRWKSLDRAEQSRGGMPLVSNIIQPEIKFSRFIESG